MRAAVLRKVGAELAIEEVPAPSGFALDVRAAGANFADVLIRTGRYPQMPELPLVLGAEVAGELDGRRVVALVPGIGGGFAERAEVDPEWVFDLPEGATFAKAAALLLTYLTAWLPLTRQVHLREGQTVLVHAGAGGVGSASIQLAKHLGARVIATAGSPEKQEVACRLGADEVYGYDDFGDVRADVVLDPVGGTVFADSLKVLDPLGSIVAIGFAAGLWGDLNPQLLVGRNIAVHGFYFGRLRVLRPEVGKQAVRELLDLWAEGAIDPVVGTEFPLEQANDALALLESRRSIGKIVVMVP
jgi:NADPH:quinone reductase